MRVEINGRDRELPDTITLAELITATAGSSRGSAAVVDGEVVPRGDWAIFAVREGHNIELIIAVQGG